MNNNIPAIPMYTIIGKWAYANKLPFFTIEQQMRAFYLYSEQAKLLN